MSAVADGHGLTGIPDAGAYLARLTRLDPRALVRLRATQTAARTALWARLPWGVLVSRTVSGAGPGDATVSAAALLAELGAGGALLPARRDAAWRWPLPSSAGRVVETLAGSDLRRLAAAAAGTLRTAAAEGVRGRAVGQRVLRDALLDHVAVVVTGPPATGPSEAGAVSRVEVSQRLVQAVVRMGFLGPSNSEMDKSVDVRLSGRWVGISAPYGIAWLRTVDQLMVKPGVDRTNG